MTNKFRRKETANVYNESTSSIINDQINELCSAWCSPGPPSFHLAYDHVQFPPFSILELEQVLASVILTSAPGSDSIDYLILKILSNGIKSLLLKLLLDIVNSGSFPKE